MKIVQLDVELSTTIEIEVKDDCDIEEYGWEDEYEDDIYQELNFYHLDHIVDARIIEED